MNKITLLIHPEELSVRWIDRSAELGIDNLSLHPAGGYRASQTLKELLKMQGDSEYRKLIDYAHEKGLLTGYQFHAAGYLLPRELFQKNPALFRMNEKGERTGDYNFCVSNEKAMETVTENALKVAKTLYRNTDFYYFWMDDKPDSFCHCEKCRSLSPSDQNLLVANAILKKLRTWNPEAKVACLCYKETTPVPKTIRKSDGVFLEYAPIERDIRKSCAEDSGVDKENIKQLIRFFGEKDAEILEYWFDNSKYSGWTKPPKKFLPNPEVIREDFRFYHSLGFENCSSFACYLGKDYLELYGEPDLSAIERTKK